VEAEADARTTQALIHRVLAAKVEWLQGYSSSDFDQLELWHQEKGRDWLKWTDLKGALETLGVKLHYTNWKRGSGYETNGNMALQLIAALRAKSSALEKPNALIMVVDHDGDDTRRPGLEAAGRLAEEELVVIVGVPVKKREAWVLNAFNTGNDGDHAEVEVLRRELTFHPLRDAHKLRGEADRGTAERDVKWVLRRLCPTETHELEAIRTADLAELKARGSLTGLSDFLESAEKLIPLLDPGARAQQP
jgi:hypothetical protein